MEEDEVEVVRRPAAVDGAIGSFEAQCAADFEMLAAKMAEKLNMYEGKPGFMVTLKGILRSVTPHLSTEECKDLSSFVTVISNDKIKADRDKDKKPKKKTAKGKISVGAGKATDMDAFGGMGGGGSGWGGGGGGRDDDFDFM